MRWEITFVKTVCDAESIGVVFARARTPNQKNQFLSISNAYIGGPLAIVFFKIFARNICFQRVSRMKLL